MSFSEWAYSATQANPAELVSRDTAEINALVRRDTDGTKSASTYRESSAATLNGFNTYPVNRPGAAPDEWWVADPTQDVPSYVTTTGITYDIQRGYREMVLAEAQAQARVDLAGYYQEFIQSVFQAGASWYQANLNNTNQWLAINAFIDNGRPVDYVIADVDQALIRVTTQQNWTNFTVAWDGLFAAAQTALENAWTAVTAATTTDEVRQIMAALPAIPTVP